MEKSKDNLRNFQYLDAYAKADHEFKRKIDKIGKCKLDVKLDDKYNKRIARMRKPKHVCL